MRILSIIKLLKFRRFARQNFQASHLLFALDISDNFSLKSKTKRTPIGRQAKYFRWESIWENMECWKLREPQETRKIDSQTKFEMPKILIIYFLCFSVKLILIPSRLLCFSWFSQSNNWIKYYFIPILVHYVRHTIVESSKSEIIIQKISHCILLLRILSIAEMKPSFNFTNKMFFAWNIINNKPTTNQFWWSGKKF